MTINKKAALKTFSVIVPIVLCLLTAAIFQEIFLVILFTTLFGVALYFLGYMVYLIYAMFLED